MPTFFLNPRRELPIEYLNPRDFEIGALELQAYTRGYLRKAKSGDVLPNSYDLVKESLSVIGGARGILRRQNDPSNNAYLKYFRKQLPDGVFERILELGKLEEESCQIGEWMQPAERAMNSQIQNLATEMTAESKQIVNLIIESLSEDSNSGGTNP